MMRTRVKNIEECTRLFKIEIPKELVQHTADEVYSEIRKIARIPGFRTGTAPQDLLEKHYSDKAEEEILKRLIPKGYKKALETHRVVPVGMPRISNIDFQKGKPITFEAEVDIRPNTRLKNYKGIKVKKERIRVLPEEIDEALLRLRNLYAEFNDVERPAKKGDYVVCDVEAFIDGKPITGKNKNMWVIADREASLLGIGERLVGLAKGEEKEIEAKLPDNYPDKRYAGRVAAFKVSVHAVKEKKLPALDDEFAKRLNSDCLDSLRKEVESQLYARKESNLKINMKNQIIARLLKDCRFSVPSSLVRRQKEVLAKRLESEMLQRGVNKEEAKKEIQEMDGRLKQDAQDRVRIYFILDDIALRENIEVNGKDIDRKIESIARSAGRSPKEIRDYYEKQDLLGGLSEDIKEEKVLDLLLREANIIDEK